MKAKRTTRRMYVVLEVASGWPVGVPLFYKKAARAKAALVTKENGQQHVVCPCEIDITRLRKAKP